MEIDEEDLFLLKEFCKLKENEYTTTWKLMKKSYPKGNSRENMRIKQKLKRLSKLGLFTVEGKPEMFTLNSDKVYLKKMFFPCKECKSYSIWVEIDGKWIIFEIY